MKIFLLLPALSVVFCAQSLGDKEIVLPSLKEETFLQFIEYDLNKTQAVEDLLARNGVTADVLEDLRFTFMNKQDKPSFKKCYALLKLYHEAGKQDLVRKMKKVIFTTFSESSAMHTVLSMVELNPFQPDIVADMQNMTNEDFWYYTGCLTYRGATVEAHNILLALYPHPVDFQFFEKFCLELGDQEGLDFELLFSKLNFVMTTDLLNHALAACRLEIVAKGLLACFDQVDFETLCIAFGNYFSTETINQILARLEYVDQTVQ